MILQALVKYYEDLEKQGKISRRGWCTEKISYGIQLSCDGKIQAILSLKREVQAGKKNNIKSAAVICADDGNTIIRCSC